MANSIEQITDALTAHLAKQYPVPEQSTAFPYLCTLNLDQEKEQFGDLSSNAALILAKSLNKSPRQIAQDIVQSFKHPHVAKIEIAGPGFLNIFLTPDTYPRLAQELWNQQAQFFKPTIATPRTICLEFVSANPTGPLHLGHGRSGIIGDVLSNILRFAGHKVTKEFYINDAGSQITKLGVSLKIRCQQVLGKNIALPEDAYHGDYLIALAQQCIKQHSPDVLNQPDEFFATYAKDLLLADIKETLASYGITFDVWFSEKTLHTDGSIDRCIKLLADRGYIYERDGAVWFTSTLFGDDKDRVVRKASGELTYAAADIAYTENKLRRGHDLVITVLGQDHHSYVTRLKGIIAALGYSPDQYQVPLYQLVSLKEDGEVVRMSKRTGKIIMLKDIIQAVGKDAARFFFLNRKAEAHLEFDIALASKKTEENPVYYLQYAYVRTKSVLTKAQEMPELSNITPDDLKNLGPEEWPLLKKIASLKDVIAHGEQTHQTHLLSYYARELAHTFHRYYAQTRIIGTDDIPARRARLALIHLLRMTLATTLDLLGLEKPESM